PFHWIWHDASHRYRTRHRRADHVKASFALCIRMARHKLHQASAERCQDASHRPTHSRPSSGYLRSQRGKRTAGLVMVAVLQRQMPTDELLPAFTRRNSLQRDDLFPAKVGKPLLDGFDEQVVFATEMLVKGANRQPRYLHQACDARSAQPPRPEST